MRGASRKTDVKSFSELKAEKVYPFLAVDCHVHTTPSESWLFYPSSKSNQKLFQTYETLQMDHTDEEVIFSCDGRTSLLTILKVLKKVYRISERRTLELLDSLLLQGIVSFAYEPLYSSSFPTFGGSRDYFVPLHMFLELVDHCNQECIHCYMNAKSNGGCSVSKERLFELLEMLSLEGTLVVELTGGEPLMHPDFKEILAFCAEYFDVVSVITNGTLIDNDMVCTIKDLSSGESRILVSVSLNSFDENFHDEFTGKKGSFKSVINSIRLLASASIPVRVSMNVTKSNITHIVDTAKLAIDCGASVFAAAPVNPEGRAKSSNICLDTLDEWTAFDAEFLRAKEKFEEKIFVLPEPALSEIYRFSCGAGTKTVSVDPSGNARPCVLFESDFTLGNLFEEGIEKVLSEENLGIFTKIKGPAQLGCQKCVDFSYCNGCVRRMLVKSSENEGCKLKYLTGKVGGLDA